MTKSLTKKQQKAVRKAISKTDKNFDEVQELLVLVGFAKKLKKLTSKYGEEVINFISYCAVMTFKSEGIDVDGVIMCQGDDDILIFSNAGFEKFTGQSAIGAENGETFQPRSVPKGATIH